ncbi:FAD-binding protein [Streptomyces sp. NBC_01520]|uniref:FAD-binding protein n=1 Tax=Streptomyces sp. NBC_01520 TaxID=2903892 RepID=UPI00386F921C
MPTAPTPTTNWAGNVTFGTSRIHRPRSVDELRRLVAGSRHIRALGSGHSFSRIADTTGELVLLDGLPRRMELDPVAGTVTVAAGMKYAHVVEGLHQAGFALPNMASLPHISVAGSVATGTHGSGDTLRSLAATVQAMEFVGPEGDVFEVRRDADGERFAGSVISLGALGVVTKLTLGIESAYKMTQRVRVGVGLDEAAERLDDVFGAAYSVSLFTDWLDGECHVYLKDRTDRPISSWAGGREAAEPVHPCPGMPTDFCTEQLGVAGWWHERLPHFKAEFIPGAGEELQSEYFVPRAAARAAFEALGRIGSVIAPVIHISEVRSVRGDDLWLSPAYGQDSITFHFTWINSETEIRPAMAAVEEALMPLGARPHWGKLTASAPAQVVGRYDRAGHFARLMAECDPARKFANSYVDALFPIR